MLATPTFLAGACFVLVATMAYGTTQTHLLYSEPTCQAARCSIASPHQNGGVTLKTSARPGVGGSHRPAHPGGQGHQPGGSPSTTAGGGGHTSHPAGTHHASSPQSLSQSPPSVGGGSHGPQVAILFHTLKRWHGGFMAAITIANHSKSALDGWQLWLRYRVTGIDRMWGAHWFPASAHGRNAGLAAALSSEPKVKPGGNERFTFRASGTPAAPVGCSFDGYRCTFKIVTGTGGKIHTSGGKTDTSGGALTHSKH
jgi:Cellulose binding domain